MKKKILYMISGLAVSALLTACQKVGDDTKYSPDETLYRTGEVSLCLSVENLTTKLSMDDLGHFLFEEDDSIAAVCTDGTIFKMYLSGSGDTKRAFFKGKVPEGKSLGDVVFYPYSCIKSCTHGIVCMELPSSRTYSDAYVCPMIGKINGENFKVEMTQAAACLRLSIKNFPEDVKTVVFSDAGGNAISGEFDCDLSGSGIVAKRAEGNLTFTLDEAYSKPQFNICLPSGDYSSLSVAFYDKSGLIINYQKLAQGELTFERASLTRMEIQSAVVIKSYKLMINDSQSVKMTETSSNHYEATFDAPAAAEIVMVADGTELGFTSYSGAGGLGKCKNKYSALPYYSFTDQHTNFYEVSEAIGALYPLADGGNKFWLNMDEPATVKAVMDLNYGSYGSYYLQVVSEDDPNLVLAESFDLFTCGGDQTWYLKGTKYEPTADSYDGLMAGASAKSGWNASGGYNEMWDYPTKTAAVRVANETYIKNRGVDDGWVFQQVDERPGAIQLSQGGIMGKLTTPAFSKLSGPSNVCFSIKLNRYSSTSSQDIYFVIKNGGKFKSGHAHQTEATDCSGNHFDEINAELTGLDSDTFTVTQEYCMLHYSDFNKSINKSVSTFDLNIEGATPQTKIEIYPADGNCRFLIYDIKVVKK